MSNKTGFQVPTRNKPDPAAVASFLAGADGQAGQGAATPATPAATQAAPALVDFSSLDDTRSRPAFSMRLTDRRAAQLKHIAATTPYSAHSFCLEALEKALDAHFNNLK